MTGPAPSPPKPRWATIGRRVGTVGFALVVGVCATIWTVQILIQVWGTPDDTSTRDCRSSVGQLIVAVHRARDAAAREPAGERAALARFRAQLAPEWDARAAIGLGCRRDIEALRALAEIDRFRYAEEHSVRYSAADLAKRRRNVRLLEHKLGIAKSGPVAESQKD